MSPEAIAALMVASLLLGIFVGFPLAFVLGGVGIIFGYFTLGLGVFPMLVTRVFGTMSNYILVAVPLFIFMGNMMERSGIGEELYSGIYLWFGRLRGGLAIGTMAICTLLAASTGIMITAIIGVGVIALPAMLNRGYQKGLATGTIASGGTLGILIPPSIMLVLYGAEVGLSVGKLFAAAIFPGLLLSALYLTYITLRCAIQPHLGPALPPEDRMAPLKTKFLVGMKAIFPPIFLILAVLGTIFWGIATPTEAAGVGAFGAIILAAARRRLSLANLKEVGLRTLKTTSLALFIVVGATCFTSVFIAGGGGKAIMTLMVDLPIGPFGILVLILLILFILGMFIDWIGILMIIIPIFLPIVTNIGFDPLWFALLVCVNLQMSFLTPPFGYALFYTKAIAPHDVNLLDIYRGIIPFVALQMLTLVVCVLFPNVVLWLPSVIVG